MRLSSWVLSLPTFLVLGVFSSASFGAIERIQGSDLLTGKKLEYYLGSSEARAKKATVVVFLSAKCPCSQSHEEVLKQLHKDFSGPDFQFIGVHSNADEGLEMTQLHFEKAGLPFAVLHDEKAEIADQLGAYKTPHVYVIGKGQEVLFRGGVDDSHHAPAAQRHYLRNALTAIRDGKPIADRAVRVLGCAIKRP
jgi:peroxiredoxin